MKKIILNTIEDRKYQIIKKLVESNGNKLKAALKLQVTPRTIDRLILKYKHFGKEGFVHGNRNRKPKHSMSFEEKEKIVFLYKEKYFDCNIQHFSELLADREGIKRNASTLLRLLKEYDILSVKAHRKTKKALKKKLKEKARELEETDKKNLELIEPSQELDNAHPRRAHCKYFGEMLQMDASDHEWIKGIKCHLHAAIDDSTGMIVGAYFDVQETLNGYYHVTAQIFKEYGIPYMFYTDNRTVFEYRRKGEKSIEKDTFTQFGYMCHNLGIALETTSISQAKGKIERLFQTLQSRLIAELRLEKIETIEQANEYLPIYIQKFNEQFALKIDNNKNVFENQLTEEEINLNLSVISKRKVDSGCCISYKNKYYRLEDENEEFGNFRRGTEVIVVQSFDKKLYGNVSDKLYTLVEVPKEEKESRYFGVKEEVKKEKKKYIPPLEHPWKKKSFEKYLEKQQKAKGKGECIE